MMQIGELAAIAGVSTRAVRHYHAQGVLIEPPRRSNGYREYGSRDLLSLLRVVRLTALGLSLDEVRDVLGDPSGTELQNILADVAADLEHQQEQLTRQRARIATALAADDHLAFSPQIAELVARIRPVVDDPDLVRAEHEALELFEATMAPETFANLTDRYRHVLDDPVTVSAAGAVQKQFAALTDQDPDHPDVLAVAAQLREIGVGMLPDATDDRDGAADEPSTTVTASSQSGDDGRAWQLFLDTLTPAQRHAVLLVSRQWEAS